MQANGYVGVSGQGQLKGDGFICQEETIRGYTEKHGITLVQMFHEKGVSGTKGEDDRPAFQEMLAAILANGVKTIIVESLDRLAREYRIQEQL